jgi:hypothetical protein
MLGRAASVDSSVLVGNKNLTALKRQRLESSILVEDIEQEVQGLEAQEGAIIKSERKKQVIRGKFERTLCNNYNVMLIAEECPIFAVDYSLARQESKFWIYCPKCSENFKWSLPKFCKWVSRDETMKITSHEKSLWIVLQGRASFIDEAVGTYLSSAVESRNFLCILPAVRLWKFKWLIKTIKTWRRIKHESVGRITTSQWLLGISIAGTKPTFPGIEELIPSFGLRRRLLDIVHKEPNVF